MTAQTILDEFALGMALRDVASTEQSGVVVVLSTRRDAHAPDFDLDAVTRATGPDGRVLVVPAHLTSQLNARLGDDFTVYGGAARVFPVRRADAPYAAPLVGSRNTTKKARLDQLVRHIERAWAASAPPPTPTVGAPTAPQAGRPDLTFAAGAVTPVDSPDMAVALAAHLLNPERTRPALLLTRRAGDHRPPVDVSRIVQDVGTLVDIFEMGTGEVSWAFSEALARFPGTECYGGAGRVYPVGLEWTTNLDRSPLRFTWDASHAAATTEALIRDALASSRLSSYTAQPIRARRVTGTVKGSVSGRGLVSLDQGGMATIWPELVVEDVDAEHLVQPGMRVEGDLDEATGRLDVAASLITADVALATFQHDDLVTARVVAVEREIAVLEIFPGVQPVVPAEDIVSGRFVIDVRQWLTVGEILSARIVQAGEADDDWQLSLLDVDPDEAPLPAPALLPGGPPWLPEPLAWDAEPEPEASDVEEPTVDRAPEPVPSVTPPPTPVAEAPPAQQPPAREPQPTDDALRVMTAERDALAREVARLQDAADADADELKRLRRRGRDQDQTVSRLTKQLAAKDKQLAGVEGILEDRDRDRNAFPDPAEQFRYEVDLEWARRIPAAEKPNLPRASYLLGADFLPSLAEVSDRDRAKAVEVVIEVITGRVYDMPGRRTHQMRTGAGGDDAYLSRADGATCWRVNLQHGTPQARRLHFWALPTGEIELSSVRIHDDMRP
ncbi:MAG TPA: hypothetical protein GXZ45_12965 [Propionibacterium sp.]|nr:hypothetical protein [Propionibacterium sp.]